MPIEIRELIIKTTVSDKKNTAGGSGADSGGKLQQAQINEIAEKIFEIIKEKSER